MVEGKPVPTVPLSSYVREKRSQHPEGLIQKGEFLLGEPQQLLPTVTPLKQEMEPSLSGNAGCEPTP